MSCRLRAAAVAALALACLAAMPARAQLVPRPDGAWRGLAGLAFSSVSGNSSNRSLALNADVVRQTATDKFTASLQTLRTEARIDADRRSTELMRLTGKFDRDLADGRYVFASAGVERDTAARLDSRLLAGAGAGLRLLAEQRGTFEVFGGGNVRADRYAAPGVFSDGTLTRERTFLELQAGEEWTHQWTETTSFRERLVIYPQVEDLGQFRSVLEASLVVTMTRRLKLTVSALHRYDNAAAAPILKSDLTLLAGVSWAFGPE